MIKMNSSRPYLVRAIYEWIISNDATPYIVARTDLLGVHVPQSVIKGNRVILNISPKAVHDLILSNKEICFNACFSEVPHAVRIPIQAIEAMYAKENGQGMIFDKAYEEREEHEEEDTQADDRPSYLFGKRKSNKKKNKKGGKEGGSSFPHLTIIK